MSKKKADKKGKGRKKYSPYNLYIPENLLIDELLKTNPPSFPKMPKRYWNYRDSVIYIVHLLNSIPHYQNDFDLEQSKGYIPIHKETLRDIIHEYRAYINYLIEQEVIEEGSSYVPGKRSMGLKFKKDYLTKVKAIQIITSTLIKSIVQNVANRDFEAEAKLHFLKSWFNSNLTIDYEKALEYLELDKEASRKKNIKRRLNYSPEQLKNLPSIEEVVLMGYNSKFITVDRIYNSDFHGFPKIDKTTGRLHSPLTRLKKGMRKFLRYNNEVLCSIDIVNSQPLLALIVLDLDIFQKQNIGGLISKYNPLYSPIQISESTSHPSSYYTMLVKLIKSNSQKPDVILFKNSVIAGNFYETFSTILEERGLIPTETLNIINQEHRTLEIRKYAKNAVFRAFFSKTQASCWCSLTSAFKACFPNVYSIFQLVKRGKGYHNTLACIFQRFESHLILHRVSVDLYENHPHIPLFTIHDSICTTYHYANLVNMTLVKHLKEAIGVEPKLKVERWE